MQATTNNAVGILLLSVTEIN